MTAFSAAELFTELDATIAASSSERCARMLRRTAELLVASNDRLQAMQVGMLDDVLLRLAGRMAPSTLVELATTLADLRTAPMKTLRHLATSEHPAVAVPILRKSPALSQADLVEIATSCNEDYLLAIAQRRNIGKPLTDVLVLRGSRKICLAIIGNAGADFSDAAYAILTGRAKQDDEITKALALRPGVPDMIVRELLSASPRPATTAKTPSASPGQSASSIPAAAKRAREAEYAAARPEIVSLNRTGKLNDSTVNRFAIRGETANLFTALSVLSGAPIGSVERVMAETDCEGLVMACRASRLNWQTTLAILNTRSARLSFGERDRARDLFEKLHLSTSQWSVRWGEIAVDADDRTAKSGGSR